MARIASHEILPNFTARQSKRAMNGEPIPLPTLQRLLEAARWAPSSANSQPWRFLYALKGTPEFETFFALLDDGNRAWCVRAGALLVLSSCRTMPNGKPAPHHAFDSGSAWVSLALQGSSMGLVTHAMAGFYADRARAELGVPEGFDVQCMIAIGFPGNLEDLPERQRPREAPSDRRPVSEWAHAGTFPEAWRLPAK